MLGSTPVVFLGAPHLGMSQTLEMHLWFTARHDSVLAQGSGFYWPGSRGSTSIISPPLALSTPLTKLRRWSNLLTPATLSSVSWQWVSPRQETLGCSKWHVSHHKDTVLLQTHRYAEKNPWIFLTPFLNACNCKGSLINESKSNRWSDLVEYAAWGVCSFFVCRD